MSTIADLLIKVRADTAGATKNLKDVGSKGTSSLGKIGKAAGMAGLALGATAGVGLAFAAKAGFNEFVDGQKIAAQTEAVLKSTGGAAGVTAAHINNLSGALLKKSGVDDEAIQSGANLLLTFTNIRNEAGKGNDIFDQTTKTMLDMSVALGQDTSASAIQLGKALNDPVKGVTALQRVGVSFTQSQRDQIKAMVDAGNTMGAQKLILAELNKEFGGSAEAAGKTFAGQLNVARETLNNYAGAVVGAAIPALANLATWFNAKAIPAIGSFITVVQTRATPILKSLIPTFMSIGHMIVDTFLPIVKNLATIFMGAVTAIAKVVAQNRPQLEQLWRNLSTLIRAVADVALPILRVAFTKVLPLILSIVIPIVAKLSGLFVGVAKVINGAASAVEAVIGAGRALATFVQRGLNAVAPAFQRVFGAVAAAVSPAIGVLQTIIGLIQSVIGTAQSAIGMIDRVSGAAGKIKGALGHIPGFASGVRNFAGGLAVVGERGPELVDLPRGSSVFTNQASRGMVRGGDGGDESGDVVLVLDGDVLARFTRRELSRKGTRNVGLAFGSA